MNSRGRSGAVAVVCPKKRARSALSRIWFTKVGEYPASRCLRSQRGAQGHRKSTAGPFIPFLGQFRMANFIAASNTEGNNRLLLSIPNSSIYKRRRASSCHHPTTPAQYKNRVAAIVNTPGRKDVRFCAEHVLRPEFSTSINAISDEPFEKRPSHQRQTLLVYSYSYCIAKTPLLHAIARAPHGEPGRMNNYTRTRKISTTSYTYRN